MGKYTKDDIKFLAGHMKRARDDQSTPFNLLTGAGCSLSAGIPLAPALVDEINKLFKDDCLRKLSKDKRQNYGACMSILSKEERKKLLGRYLENAQVNWAHLAIASLMKEGFIGRVMTFNFDSVLAKACSMVGIYPATYDFVSGVTKQTAYLADQAILHLHGQGHSLALMNSEKETKEHAENLKPLFRAMFEQSPILIAGYSGKSDEVYPIMRGEYTGQHRVIWTDYDEVANNNISDFIESAGASNDFIGGADADRFFMDIAEELGCWPPKLFTSPDDHILELLESVCDFPMSGTSKTDILGSLKSKLEERKNSESITISEAEANAMLGNWDKIISLISEDTTNEDEKNLLAWAYISQGIELAKSASGPALYEQAFEKFKKALEIKSDKHEALYNWGVGLGKLADSNNDPTLYEQAFEKYEKALEIKSDSHDALYNWGVDLGTLAELNNDPALYAQAFEKYEKALEIKPDKYEALYNWGVGLGDLADSNNDPALYAQAFEKYEKALEIKSDSNQALYNWGVVLGKLADLNKDPALYEQAFEKYEKTLEIMPDDHAALNNWGIGLRKLADLNKDPALYAQAFEKYEKALEIKPDKHEVFNNWGIGLDKLADLNKDPALYAQAFEKYEKALEIMPDKHAALNNWGVSLSKLADLNKDPALYEQAFEKYKKALENKPDYHDALNNWGSNLLDLFKLTDDQKFLKKSEEILLKANETDPTKSYNLACNYALQGREDDARIYLNQCLEKNTLPNKTHIMADEDLTSLKRKKWFQELVSKLD